LIFNPAVVVPVPGGDPIVLDAFTEEFSHTCGGGFNATLTGKKATVTFSGTGTLGESRNGVPTGAPNTFSLNGLKVGDQSATTTATAQ
jgi:hypothetical protein